MEKDRNQKLELQEKAFEYLSKKGLLEQLYVDRLQFELDIFEQENKLRLINFLVELQKEITNRDTPWGISSGITSSSLLFYCVGLTNLDPIAHGLCFERFFNSLGNRRMVFVLDLPASVKLYNLNNFANRCGFKILALPSQIEGESLNPREILILNEEERATYPSIEKLNYEGSGIDIEISYYTERELIKMDYMPVHLSNCNTSLWINQLLNETETNISNIDFEVEDVFILIETGKLDDIIDFKNDLLKDMFHELRPRSLDDLCLGITLNYELRANTFFSILRQRKKGVLILDTNDCAKNILRESYGHIIYQEQVNNLISQCFGLTQEEADFYRTESGKRKFGRYKAIKETLFKIENDNEFEEKARILVEADKYGRRSLSKSYTMKRAYDIYTLGWFLAHYDVSFESFS
jgi:DNA polymerase III alpha subunit